MILVRKCKIMFLILLMVFAVLFIFVHNFVFTEQSNEFRENVAEKSIDKKNKLIENYFSSMQQTIDFLIESNFDKSHFNNIFELDYFTNAFIFNESNDCIFPIHDDLLKKQIILFKKAISLKEAEKFDSVFYSSELRSFVWIREKEIEKEQFYFIFIKSIEEFEKEFFNFEKNNDFSSAGYGEGFYISSMTEIIYSSDEKVNQGNKIYFVEKEILKNQSITYFIDLGEKKRIKFDQNIIFPIFVSLLVGILAFLILLHFFERRFKW